MDRGSIWRNLLFRKSLTKMQFSDQMPECCIGFFKDKTADEATIDLSADMHFVGMKVGFVRVLRFLTGCSVSTVSFPAKTTPLNDRIGDMGCIATTHVPQLRENAASAKSEKRMTAKCQFMRGAANSRYASAEGASALGVRCRTR